MKTDLQRELAPSGANVLVFIDTTDALKNNRITIDALKLQDLQRALRVHQAADKKLHFQLFYPKRNDRRSDIRDFLRYALIGLGYEAGFSKVTAGSLYPNDDRSWAEQVAGLTGEHPQPMVDESAAVKDGVTVYPVRTELSRYLTSDADCAVVILPPIEKAQGAIPKNIEVAIKELVGKLKVSQKKRMSFYLRPVPREDIQPLLREFDKLAKNLGFEANSVIFR